MYGELLILIQEDALREGKQIKIIKHQFSIQFDI